MRTCVVVIACAVLIAGQFVLPASSAVDSYDGQGLGDEAVGEYSENYYDRFVPTNQKRSCVRRGGSCDHRPKDCCHNSSCRCNLWGANCRCQRMGLFQKWG